MSAFLSGLSPRPADALLGLMAAFRADPRDAKIDLGVGIYRDEAGETPIMAAVRQAEERLLTSETTKAYEGPQGNPDFCAAIEEMVLGAQSEARGAGRVVSFATPGGCGALFVAIMFAGRISAEGRIWASDPTWPNHVNLVHATGRELKSYSYVDPEAGTVDFPAMMDDLREARPGDVVLLQGPCHNPTGIDLTPQQWAYLGDFCAKQLLMPLVDVAYHGFGEGLEADIAGVRALLEVVPEAMVAYSCSKNFGLYRERTGCLMLQAGAPRDVAAGATHLADIARAAYSMPPSHGAAIVATILGDDALAQAWRDELEAMRNRMQSLRGGLAAALAEETGRDDFSALTRQKGMFSQLPLAPQITELVRLQQAVYLPASGRINIAGLTSDTLGEVARRLAPYFPAPQGQPE
jgi:aspartate/tyrosine/aromatic aminotransferase